ncbi:MAG: hypothetical protein V4732_11440 [Pseudomonadota bacterium]
MTGSNTFQFKITNVYSWQVDEYVGGTWATNFLYGGSSGTPAVNFTRKGGTYTFRLRNCYNVSNACSTSTSKNVTLQGSAPATPTISATSGYTSITVSWAKPTGTSSVFTRNGAVISVSGNTYADTAAVGGATYTYSVKNCNAIGDCSATASTSAALAVNPSTQTKTSTYSYDELGRLTFVSDPANGNRDFDYDNAGNRILVSTKTLNDSTAEPGLVILPAPANPYSSLIASCAWRATWTLVSGAAKYLVKDTSNTLGGSQYVTTNEAFVACPVGNSAGNKPKTVQACTASNVCGTEAYFN